MNVVLVVYCLMSGWLVFGSGICPEVGVVFIRNTLLLMCNLFSVFPAGM